MKASWCRFCHNLEPQLASNRDAFSILDSRPVSPGHSLVISRNHAPTIFDLPPAEYAAATPDTWLRASRQETLPRESFCTFVRQNEHL
jgi:diadenosine tetraphosphate (Ap4A) HIT family hydrolase